MGTPTAVAEKPKKEKKAKVKSDQKFIRVPISKEMSDRLVVLTKEKKLPRTAVNNAIVAAHVAAFKTVHGDTPDVGELVKASLFS